MPKNKNMELKTYGDWPDQYKKLENSKVVILPAPYDATSTWIKGADKGPQAIIAASINMEGYDIETKSEVYKHGIHTAKALKLPVKPELMAKKVEEGVSQYLAQDKMVVLLGGEHSVSIGAIRAYAKKYPNLSVLQFDAHADSQDEYHGSKYNHNCVMARAREVAPVVQVGIRSVDSHELKMIEPDRIFFAEDIHDNDGWQKKAIEKLTDQVYITIDLDVFDIGLVSATGTPEPGGLGWYPMLKFLKRVVKEKRVVGFDVVELCPNKFSKASDYLATRLIYKILSYIYS